MNIQDIKKAIDLGFTLSYELLCCTLPSGSMIFNISISYYDVNKKIHSGLLRTARGDIRDFKTFETAYKFLASLSVEDFKVFVSPSEIAIVKEKNSQLDL